MRTSLFVAALAALSIVPLARPAAACGTESAFEKPVTIRPVGNVAATDLFNEAERLEARANALEGRAQDVDAAADEQAVEARALRIEAATVEGAGQRDQMIARASVLAQAATTGHGQARAFRTQASQLRLAARADRTRAIQLTGGVGGTVKPGWRTRPVREITPLPVTPRSPTTAIHVTDV